MMIHKTDFGLGHLDNFLMPSSDAKPHNRWSYSRIPRFQNKSIIYFYSNPN